MQKILIIFILLLTFLQNSVAEEVDDFGQKVPISFSETVKKAKSMRLPYSDEYNPNNSVKILTELINEKSDYYRALYNLGLAYSELGEYQKANETFDKALKIREEQQLEDLTIFNSAGWVSLNEQNYERAEKLFKKGLEYESVNSLYSNRALHNNIGLLYFYTQKFDDSKKYLEKATEKYNSESAKDTLKIIENIEKRFNHNSKK